MGTNSREKEMEGMVWTLVTYLLCSHISDSADSVVLCEEEAVGTIISDSGSLQASPALCHP